MSEPAKERSDSEISALEWKLGKRGFRRDPRPIDCNKCGERAVFIFLIKHTSIGGREIEWCFHCQNERGFRRPGGGDRVEEEGFDLERFLA